MSTKEKEQKKEKKKSKVIGWSTQKTEEKESKQVCKNTEKWCTGGASIRKELKTCGRSCRKIEEEVLEKCKVEVSKRGAYKGRGEPSQWRMVRHAPERDRQGG